MVSLTNDRNGTKNVSGGGKSNSNSLEDERGSYFKQKSGADCVRAPQQPPSPFSDWYFQTRCADFG